MKKARRAFIVLLMSAPALAFAQTTPTTFSQLVTQTIVPVLTAATAALIGIAVVYYLWTLAISIFKAGQGKAPAWENLRTLTLWGVLILFLIVMVWGVIRVLGNSLFGGGYNPQVGL